MPLNLHQNYLNTKQILENALDGYCTTDERFVFTFILTVTAIWRNLHWRLTNFFENLYNSYLFTGSSRSSLDQSLQIIWHLFMIQGFHWTKQEKPWLLSRVEFNQSMSFFLQIFFFSKKIIYLLLLFAFTDWKRKFNELCPTMNKISLPLWPNFRHKRSTMPSWIICPRLKLENVTLLNWLSNPLWNFAQGM